MPVTQPEVTLDWFWPYFSHKREIVDWAKLIFNLSRGDEPGHRKTDYWPSWKPGATRDGIPFAEELHRAANMDPTSTHHPASYAEKTFANSPPPHPHRRLQMKRLLGRLDAADAMVVLHQPPMHPGVFTWLEEHPKARKRYEAFLDYVRSLEQDNVLVYIVEEPEEVGSTADEMIDYGHLGGEAARKYTQALAAFLKDRQKE